MNISPAKRAAYMPAIAIMYAISFAMAKNWRVCIDRLESGISDKTVDEIFEEALQRHRKKKKNL